MCRNIRTLFNFEPPVTDEEIRAASLQFVRKISGFQKPSKANEAVFDAAVDEIAQVSRRLLGSLESSARPRNRQEETAKAKARAVQRFGPSPRQRAVRLHHAACELRHDGRGGNLTRRFRRRRRLRRA